MALRTLVVENLWLKSFSLMLAILIWLAIQSNPSDYQVAQTLFPHRLQVLELRCPIAIMTPPGNHAGLNLDPGTVIVKVRGEDAVLKKLNPENIQVYVRLPELPKLNRLFPVEVIVPREVTLKEVVPDQVSVKSSGSVDKPL